MLARRRAAAKSRPVRAACAGHAASRNDGSGRRCYLNGMAASSPSPISNSASSTGAKAPAEESYANKLLDKATAAHCAEESARRRWKRRSPP